MSNTQNIIIGLFCFLSLGLFAQEEDTDFRGIESEISALGEQMHRDTSKESRTFVAQRIKELLQAALQTEGSFNYPFEQLAGIAVVQPEDKKFRIFTWELYIDKNHYQQFGLLQLPNHKTIELVDESDQMRQPEFGRNKANYWYGALYYNVVAFETGNQTQYMLFGRDSYNFFERRKVMEVLYFNHNGEPRFGNNVITIKDARGQMRKVDRYLLQYAVNADVRCNFDENLDMIIFDHLIHGRPFQNAPPTGVPDGSYCGLKLVNGQWEYVDKVFKDDPTNVLVNDQNPNEIMRRTPRKRENNLERMFGNNKKGK